MVVCFSKDVKVPVKVRRSLSSVGTSSFNNLHLLQYILIPTGGGDPTIPPEFFHNYS